MNKPRSAIPSVDAVLRTPGAEALIEDQGRTALTEAVRQAVEDLRRGLSDDSDTGEVAVLNAADEILTGWASPSLTPVFNLTGTILHTNLGRAPLPPEAIEAMARVGGASNLEYDLAAGRRGDRDVHLEERLCRLTGAEAATVVNNNAAAVLLCLNSLALRREALVSRGELIEIGGSFRIPDIMARAGAKLREVGTTNRTHGKDFAAALGPKTGLVMQVHTSNYTIQGFTAAVATKDLATLAHDHGVPLFVDLGSGTLADLRAYGLPYEPTAQEALAAGADVVSFSGDKLLGGPQGGIMVGSAICIDRIRRNPLMRALRVDKMTIAALHTVLGFYGDPDSLVERVPALRLLARPLADVQAQAQRLAPLLGDELDATVDVVDCQSQAGSGSLCDSEIPSAGLAIRPRGGKRAIKALAVRFRRLPVPVIGRVQDGVLVLDLRGLDDEAGFIAQLGHLAGDGVP